MTRVLAPERALLESIVERFACSRFDLRELGRFLVFGGRGRAACAADLAARWSAASGSADLFLAAPPGPDAVGPQAAYFGRCGRSLAWRNLLVRSDLGSPDSGRAGVLLRALDGAFAFRPGANRIWESPAPGLDRETLAVLRERGVDELRVTGSLLAPRGDPRSLAAAPALLREARRLSFPRGSSIEAGDLVSPRTEEDFLAAFWKLLREHPVRLDIRLLPEDPALEGLAFLKSFEARLAAFARRSGHEAERASGARLRFVRFPGLLPPETPGDRYRDDLAPGGAHVMGLGPGARSSIRGVFACRKTEAAAAPFDPRARIFEAAEASPRDEEVKAVLAALERGGDLPDSAREAFPEAVGALEAEGLLRPRRAGFRLKDLSARGVFAAALRFADENALRRAAEADPGNLPGPWGPPTGGRAPAGAGGPAFSEADDRPEVLEWVLAGAAGLPCPLCADAPAKRGRRLPLEDLERMWRRFPAADLKRVELIGDGTEDVADLLSLARLVGGDRAVEARMPFASAGTGDAAARLAASGVSRVVLTAPSPSILAADGFPGAGSRRALGLPLSRSILNGLPATLSAVESGGIAEVSFEFAFGAGCPRHRAELDVSYREAMGAVLPVLTEPSRGSGIRIELRGVPDCALGLGPAPVDDAVIDHLANEHFGARKHRKAQAALATPCGPNAYAASCVRCRRRWSCGGVGREYAAENGFAEFLPLPERPGARP